MRFRAIWLSVSILAMVAWAVPAASAAERRVSPRVWAERVCETAQPGAERGMARFRAVGSVPSGPVANVEEMVARVEASDVLVAGMVDVLGGLRAGIDSAGTPRIRDGATAMRAVRDDLDRLVVGLGELRDAFARFLEDPASDPVDAASEVQAAFERYLAPEVFDVLARHWPARLTRVMRRVPACMALSDGLKGAADAF